MSASLVGSEMCIRDRSCAGRPWAARPAPAEPPGIPEGGRPHAEAETAIAVSYTHLTLPTICSV
eukprot:11170267-Alexandrium_andersonii.AAC.1